MRFHGLMLLRDEADVIGETLFRLLTWIDALHVYDLGSTDGTWEIVNDFAALDARVRPFKREPTVYTDSLRCVLFDHCRAGFEPGDWIVKVDADEIYHVAPPEFVRERLRPPETIVYLQWYFFRLTAPEVAAYESGAVSQEADRRRSIVERRRFYKVPSYSEPRMFRYRAAMRWPAEANWPYSAGLTARARMPILHYPHRDPGQMARRFALRAAIMERRAQAGDHWRLADWRQEVVDPATGLALGTAAGGTAGFVDRSPLYYWQPGNALPEEHLNEHVAAGPRRLAQRFVHAALLPWIDRFRPAFAPGYRPETFSEAENQRLI